MAKINGNLRRLRMERSMTQEEVARKIGVTRQAVSGYESGRTQPGIDVLQSLAGVYDVELTEILYGRQKDRVLTALKIVAVVAAVVFLFAILAEGLARWTANSFFSLMEGVLSDEGVRIFEIRQKFLNNGTVAGEVCVYLVTICWGVLFVLNLCVRQPLKIKQKLLYVLGIFVVGAAVTLPLGLTDHIYGFRAYIYAPLYHWSKLAVLLLVSLVIDLVRWIKKKRTKKTAEIK